MLRRALIALGVVYLAVAVFLLARQVLLGLAAYLALGGVVLLAALLLERHRYRPPVDHARGPWQPTGERFVDPTTGRLVEVRYNPDTGERAYVPADEAAPGDDGTARAPGREETR
jgi:hypothetical protein